MCQCEQANRDPEELQWCDRCGAELPRAEDRCIVPDVPLAAALDWDFPFFALEEGTSAVLCRPCHVEMTRFGCKKED